MNRKPRAVCFVRVASPPSDIRAEIRRLRGMKPKRWSYMLPRRRVIAVESNVTWYLTS